MLVGIPEILSVPNLFIKLPCYVDIPENYDHNFKIK
jgi:hypothetical protein